jgi:AcrR family transcriptional regulator
VALRSAGPGAGPGAPVDNDRYDAGSLGVALGGRRLAEPRRDGNDSEAAGAGTARESTRSRLIDAASALFAERGYELTSTQDIARRAGLTTGAIYSNFRGKRELLLAAISQPAEALRVQVQEARKAGASALDLIRAGSHRLASQRGRRQGSILVNALVLASRDPIVGQKLRLGLCRTFRDFGRLVREGQAEGSIDPGMDVDAYVHYAYALTFGTYLLETAGIPGPRRDQWDALMDRFLAALSAQQEPVAT